MYIGKTPTVGNFQVCDAISVVNGQAAYTLQVGGVNVAPESANHMLVSLNGILQKPGSSFTISSSTMTFASNLATGDVIDFVQILGNVLDIGAPSDDTVTAAKLNNDVISGQTALTSEPADTDEFLVSDAGTIKRIDYSLIKGGGITMASNWRPTTTTSGTTTDITSWEKADHAGTGYIGSDMTESSGVFTFPSTGTYLIMFRAQLRNTGGASLYNGFRIRTTVNNSSYTSVSYAYMSNHADNAYMSSQINTIFNVTDTSTHKVKFGTDSAQSGTLTLIGGSASNESEVIFIRLGDST